MVTVSGSDNGGTARGDRQDAQVEFRFPLLALLVTTGVAGFLDAFALLRYGAFVANQSGNIVHIGMGLAGWYPAWPLGAVSLVGFAAGAAVMSRLRYWRHGWAPASRTLAGTILALAGWTVLNAVLDTGSRGGAARLALTAVGGLTMGGLATLFTSTRGVATTITYQSGTVARIGERAVRSLLPASRGGSQARWGLLLGGLGLLGYGTGGALGALAQTAPLWTLVWALLALALLAPTLASASA